ncbi:prolipoprotein diacylglyceryl transferase [Chengkuizengella sediminis]|uniref:prolipoprotein diacylglyceryl transferase n=1 Tax=Chengkuizengella sediminis TaxID=1885917 RepID=UPI00138A2F39|nr:prolipoprotein diacylglyceryl transferase [Chengkuizengella sediminis]NDI35241.1 prolipoprotein diacylglyceryl transferase [Chengkuizengella sediminis]
MKVILFEIGGFAVRSYGLVVVLAILLALGAAYYFAKNTAYRNHLSGVFIYVIIGAMIGARIWHVFLFQWPYYSEHPELIFAIWRGGIAIQGALIGGFLAAALYSRLHKLSFWEFADIVAPAIILGQAVGRIACFLNGDAYGAPTDSGFGIVYPEGTMAYDRYGSQPLWPAEVWEGQWNLIVFAMLLILKNRNWPTGFIFLYYNILYSIGRFSLEFLRGDSPRYALDWTAGQWTSISVILLSFIVMGFLYSLEKKKSNMENNF